MKKLIAAMVVCGCIGVLPTRAFAFVDVYGTTANERIWIGKVNHGGTTSQWVCIEGPAANDDTWTNMGLSGGMLNDYLIHGDPSDAAGGVDSITVVRSSTAVAGDCAGTGNWTALVYSTRWLDVWGEYGQDTVSGGAGDTHAWGNSGTDTVVMYSGIGTAEGNAGTDIVVGFAGTTDVLRGGTDNDCLYDSSNSWTTFDCGLGTDEYSSVDSSGGKVSCDTSEATCCGYC